MTALEEYQKQRDAVTAPFPDGVLLPAVFAPADAAIESLKCCGNCDCYTPRGTTWVCGYDDYLGSPHRPCRFTPSRWQERK